MPIRRINWPVSFAHYIANSFFYKAVLTAIYSSLIKKYYQHFFFIIHRYLYAPSMTFVVEFQVKVFILVLGSYTAFAKGTTMVLIIFETSVNPLYAYFFSYSFCDSGAVLSGVSRWGLWCELLCLDLFYYATGVIFFHINAHRLSFLDTVN